MKVFFIICLPLHVQIYSEVINTIALFLFFLSESFKRQFYVSENNLELEI